MKALLHIYELRKQERAASHLFRRWVKNEIRYGYHQYTILACLFSSLYFFVLNYIQLNSITHIYININNLDFIELN